MHGLNRNRLGPGAQRGLSIVEMMVGVAVGLIVVAAATIMVAAQLTDNRRLLLETQIQQDLRAAADLITRDLRRAGFWWDAQRGTASGGAAAGMLANPYAAVSPQTRGEARSEVSYRYANPNRAEDDAVTSDERLGFRLSGGAIESQLGAGNWQALTDPGALRVTRFDVTPDHQSVTLACHRACSPGATACPPVQIVRAYTVLIEGQAATDATVRRSIRSHVRLRNDEIVGECRD